MTVTFILRGRCLLCGCHLRGCMVRTVRVNKHSLRTRGPGLGYVDRTCPECGTNQGDNGAAFTYAGLTDDAQAKVDAYRARRWGA